LVLEQLRLTEVTRAMEVGALACDLGLPSNSSLAALAQTAPSPWGELFLAHRAAFKTLTDEISRVAEANRMGLLKACDASEQVLLDLGAGQLAGFAIPRQLPPPSSRVAR
jgi:hypothetical protein